MPDPARAHKIGPSFTCCCAAFRPRMLRLVTDLEIADQDWAG